MGLRFNPPPGWPTPPEGFTPEPGWQPDPAWPHAPPGWQLWVDDAQPTVQAQAPQPSPGQAWQAPGQGWQPAQPGQYPAAGYPMAGPYPGQPMGQASGTSGWAVAAFIFGLLGGVLLGVIFGIVALSQIRRTGKKGRGLAIAGLILSGMWVVVVGIAISLSSATRSPNGAITHRGNLDVFSLKVGDCFDNPTGATSLSSVTAIPCTHPHNAQVYAAFDLSGSDSSYPGTAAIGPQARAGCRSRTGDINQSKASSADMLRYLFPEANAWADGHRTVSCVIVAPSANLTSSLLN